MVVCRTMHRIPRLSAAQDLPRTFEDFEELTEDPQESKARAPHFISIYLAKLFVQDK